MKFHRKLKDGTTNNGMNIHQIIEYGDYTSVIITLMKSALEIQLINWYIHTRKLKRSGFSIDFPKIQPPVCRSVFAVPYIHYYIIPIGLYVPECVCVHIYVFLFLPKRLDHSYNS